MHKPVISINITVDQTIYFVEVFLTKCDWQGSVFVFIKKIILNQKYIKIIFKIISNISKLLKNIKKILI
jgi:hypothetical protein